jgi:hypothetical protein
MFKWAVFLSLIAVALSSCVHGKSVMERDEFASKVSGRGYVEVTGWLRMAGEMMLYADQAALEKDLRYPYCISGVFQDQYKMDFSKFDGNRVLISGDLLDYDTLEYEKVRTELAPRKAISDTVVPNFCFGQNVFLAKAIRLADAP